MMFDRDRIIAGHLAMLAELGWEPPPSEDVIDLILRGQLLSLRDAADVFECSDEKLRKLCELTARTMVPLGVKIADRWLVSVPRLLDEVELGRLDRDRRGPDARRHAEERAKKYEGWARPQKPLVEIISAQEA